MKTPPESNLPLYGKDDTEFRIYNVKRSPKRRDRKRTREKVLKNKLLENKRRILEKVNTSELFRLH